MLNCLILWLLANCTVNALEHLALKPFMQWLYGKIDTKIWLNQIVNDCLLIFGVILMCYNSFYIKPKENKKITIWKNKIEDI